MLDRVINVYRGDTLELVASIPLADEDDVRPENFIVGDNYMIVYDPEQSTLSVYG